ncbi:MAG TPA: hypothetical protein VFN35_08480 [Ktedonobacteraceae bacterium]|nr:hypothetical protein [Ktedonobacteraceae bacterium]
MFQSRMIVHSHSESYNHFLGTVAIEALGYFIPTGDDPMEILADNGFLRRGDNGGQM